MIEIGRLGDFNDSRRNPNIRYPLPRNIAKEQEETFKKNFPEKYPLIYELLSETTKFYETHFGDLINTIAREKRQMEFETPNRVNLTYEYELEGSENLKDGEYYLFNTRDRLSWLSIYTDGAHVAVVSRLHIIEKLKIELASDLKKLSEAIGRDQTEILEELYDFSDGKPCFIRCKAGLKSIKLRYYDSARCDEKKTEGCIIIKPIVEKRINYTYRTLAPISNCWFYVRSPKNFNIGVYYNISNEEEKVEIERSASQDLEIQSMVIKGKKQRQNINFSIDVTVPDGLKWWYNAIYAISIIAILFALSLIGIHLVHTEPITWVELLIKNAGKGWFAIVAALITTRGWLMHETHAFNRLSKNFTVFVAILLIEAFVLAGIPEKKLQENANPIERIKQPAVRDSIDSCNIIKDIPAKKCDEQCIIKQEQKKENDK
ncbi:hypothetical protein [Phocaeicola massiliensis]|uniref:hypothetical protein n=1 Tax=Phocaeicola massiliensis TaxID=204516 RepID=UPI0018A899DD|nr:hypothetical protein [Phocaeicola massiliensis]